MNEKTEYFIICPKIWVMLDWLLGIKWVFQNGFFGGGKPHLPTLSQLFFKWFFSYKVVLQDAITFANMATPPPLWLFKFVVETAHCPPSERSENTTGHKRTLNLKSLSGTVTTWEVFLLNTQNTCALVLCWYEHQDSWQD